MSGGKVVGYAQMEEGTPVAFSFQHSDATGCTEPLVLQSDLAALQAEAEALRAVEGRGVMVTMALRAAVTALAHASESDPIYLRTYEHASNSLRDYAIDAAMAAEGRDA